MEIKDTLKERGDRYGPFCEESKIAMGIKTLLRSQSGWDRLSLSQQHCLDNVIQKMARIMNGDPNYIDNWHDIAGYVSLVEKELKNESQITVWSLPRCGADGGC